MRLPSQGIEFHRTVQCHRQPKADAYPTRMDAAGICVNSTYLSNCLMKRCVGTLCRGDVHGGDRENAAMDITTGTELLSYC